MATRIKVRRDTNSNWAANNPILSSGEFGYVTDAASNSVKLKIGDGTTAWNALGYFAPSSSGGVWGSIIGTLSDQADLQTALDQKENAFTKNTAFNKNFGSSAGTVAEGNDARIIGALQASAFTDAAVTGKVITGFVSAAGTVTATDSLLQAIQKLDGNISANDGLYVKLAGSQNISGSKTFTSKQTFTTATTEMLSISLLDTTYKAALDVSAANTLRLGDAFTSLVVDPSTLSFTTSILITNSSAADNITFSPGRNNLSGVIIARNGANQVAATSGVFNNLQFTSNFVPPSGTTELRQISVTSTYNSSASGNVTFLYYAPTVTSVGTGQHYFLQNTSGMSKFGGGMLFPYVAKTGAYTITTADHTIDCTSGTFTVTLPTAIGFTGITFTIKNSGAGVITVGTTSSQTIDGAVTQSLSTQYQRIVVQSDGANWIVIS